MAPLFRPDVRHQFTCLLAKAAAVFTAGVLCVGWAWAQEETTGTLRGHLTEGADGEAVAGLEVTLAWTEGGQPESRSATTDSEGAYVFYDLPLADEISFTLSAVVKGKALERTGVALSTWTPEVVADLLYLDTSSDPAHIHVGRMTVVLPPGVGEGMANVIEFVEIHNDSDVNFAVPDEQGRQIGYRLGVPASASQVSVESGTIPTVIEASTILVLEALKPKNTVLTVSYLLPAGEQVDLSRQIYYPIEEVAVLIGDASFEMTSRGFHAGEPRSIHDEQYTTLERHSIKAGSTLDLAFKRGEAPGPRPAEGGDGGGIPLVPAILVLVLAVLTGGALGAIAMQARRGASEAVAPGGPGSSTRATSAALDAAMLKQAGADELETIRELHLGFIADLDQRHRSGSLPTELYHLLRNEQKSRLGQVLEELGSR